MSGICAVWRRDRPEQVLKTLGSRQRRAAAADGSERVEKLTASGNWTGHLGSLRDAAGVSGPAGDDRLRCGSQ